jgi:hypothetical protein
MGIVEILAIVVGVGFLIGVPALLVWSMVDFTRRRASERPGSGGFTAGIAGAMQELDRLMARPSVEHTEETQNPVLKREDDASGD